MAGVTPRNVPPRWPWVAATVALALTSSGLLAARLVRDDAGTPPAPRVTATPTPATPSPATFSPSAAPAPSPTTNPSPSPSPSFDLVTIREAPVPAMCGRPAGRLVKGRLPGVEQGYTFMGPTRSGDLDGDGVPEAVAEVTCSPNQPAEETHLLVYRTGPSLAGRVPTETGLVEDFRLADGTVEVVARLRTQGDAACCPSGLWVRRFRLNGATIVRVPSGRIDLSVPLGSPGWGTLRVGATYVELARATGATLDVESLGDAGDVDSYGCAYVSLAGTDGIGIMGGGGRVQSVVAGKSGTRTTYGTAIGDSLEQLLRVHGDRVERVPNEYSPVADVVVTEPSGLVLRYEFPDGKDRVGRIHVGERGWAMLPEGCA